ncbi:hypothetical protein FM038_021515 [Shewanella eurypsychrophilus]|uniref:DUF7669 domain-containing protein n=1 Tax=Shewanella eurypsychrophilus TaxID=2593656 RepID=A0ABX6VAI2_9GAMM|nr:MULTISPECIES: hypothetical protein [Shewanella]QFU24467.1 hypothetical protein FS418_23210 [Shewanella sp. YLB-09]QPG59667.1 hypothetical protein FM038_021515 [Shewanella eurypsychrophilus]
MERKDKISDAIKRSFKSGERITTKTIITTVQGLYPEIPEGSILPSDFCDNHSNEDPFSGNYHIFNKVSRGIYIVL